MTKNLFYTSFTILLLLTTPLNLKASTNTSSTHIAKTTSTTIPGDVNSDKVTDISDVLCMVDYILGKPVENFNANVADLNNDNTIDISDVLLLVDIILGKNINNPDDPTFPVDNPDGEDPATGV